MLDYVVAKIIDKLSVFLPVYNEKGNVEGVVLSTIKVLNDIASEWELIIVNDGSTDGTSLILKKLSSSDGRIKIITHQSNEGYGASLKSGFLAGKYPWIAFTDSDGQFDFGEITSFIDKQKETGADLVIGYYKKRQVSKVRIITSKVWEYTVFALFGLKVHDIDCGFKLISKKVIEKISPLESERGAFISSEILIKAKKWGFKFAEVPVTHFPRTKGAGTGRNINVIIKSFVDLFRLWKKLR
jgi:glycosyltransferase involved in cell wall biosynthesis